MITIFKIIVWSEVQMKNLHEFNVEIKLLNEDYLSRMRKYDGLSYSAEARELNGGKDQNIKIIYHYKNDEN
jgi:hypothetical protein